MIYSVFYCVFSMFIALFFSGFISSSIVVAEETDLLQLKSGFTEAKLGVQLREIQTLEEGAGQRLLFAVPKDAVADPKDLEEVIVIGYPVENEEEKQVIETRIQWGNALDNENYGLYIDISKNVSYPVRLFFKADHSLDIDP